MNNSSCRPALACWAPRRRAGTSTESERHHELGKYLRLSLSAGVKWVEVKRDQRRGEI